VIKLAILAVLAMSAGCTPAAAPVKAPPPLSAEAPDLILTGGEILTMVKDAPRAEALAIRGEHIVAVGSAAVVGALAGPHTRVVELHGHTVTPGLVDAHCHLHSLGEARETLSLRGAASPEAAAAVVRDSAKTRAEGEWIVGRGWDQNLWPVKEFPRHEVLDAVAPKQPVALERIDGHALWVNAAAMRAAGIGRATPDPPGGKILRDAAGEATGVFLDHATELISARMPFEPRAVTERRILAAAEQAISLGLTGVHEMGIPDATVEVYRALAREGRLPLRVYAYLAGEGQVDSLAARTPDADPEGTAMFVLRGIKLFADGALGSRGAALLAPYSDDPGNSGLSLASSSELRHGASVAAARGFQLAVHAIGDRANREVLDAFEAAGARGSAEGGTRASEGGALEGAERTASARGRDLRFRVEHAQVVAPADLPRFAALGVIASMQPTHATSDMPWAGARLGPERLRGAYAWRTILATGAHVAFGSDFPVEEASPLLGLYAAVTRQDAAGNPPGGFMPEQRLTLDEALQAFTVEPAWAAFAEAHRGKLAPGMVADVTVFDRALTADRGLLATKAELVLVGGKVTWPRAPR
jgi:predicted amidohydrolase YtcJ